MAPTGTPVFAREPQRDEEIPMYWSHGSLEDNIPCDADTPFPIVDDI
jgi:hypothetical protein